MKVLITGATGFIGSALAQRLRVAGHTVATLSRREGPGAFRWDPDRGEIDRACFAGVDAVAHLAGETVMGRWTAEKKRRILESRVRGTRLLCEAASAAASPPRAIVCSSAVGYYGDRDAEELAEDAGPGRNFLAGVCVEWEKAADPARARGLRVAHLRTGMVLSPAGGALKKMLLPFRLGLGGVVGSGAQYAAWSTLDDLTRMYVFALTDDRVSGALNAVAPVAATNREFTRALGRALNRPTVFPLPAFAAKAAFGPMAEEILLASARAVPKRLTAWGFRWDDPDLEGALRRLLAR
jgi:uncharacterized protein (TIGR01777 family)